MAPTQIPADGSISPEDTVGQRLLSDLRAKISEKNALRRGIPADPVARDLTSWWKEERKIFGEAEPLEEELKYLLPHHKQLLSLCKDPSITALEASPLFRRAGRVKVSKSASDLQVKIVSSGSDTAGRSLFYIRVLKWDRAGDALNELKQVLASTPELVLMLLPMIDSCQMTPADDPFFIPYCGYTSSTTAAERAHDDLTCPSSHFQKFSSSLLDCGRGEIVYRLYEFIVTPPGNPYSVRSDYAVQAIERVLISAFRPFALNVAPGGLRHRPKLVPGPKEKEVEMLPGDTIEADSIVELVEQHFDHFEKIKGSGTSAILGEAMGRSALKLVIESATKGLRVVNGRVVCAHVSSDITQESYRLKDPNCHYLGSRAGPGPALSQLLHLNAKGYSEHEVLRLANSGGLMQRFGPFVDLYATNTIHGALWLELAHLYRFLNVTRPVFIRAESAQVGNVFGSNLLSRMFREGSALDDFMSLGDDHEQTLSSLDDLIDLVEPSVVMLKWDELAPARYLDWAGEVAIVRRGAEAWAYSLVVFLPHAGMVKYDPRTEFEVMKLLAIAARIASIAEVATSDRLGTSRPSEEDGEKALVWFTQLRSEVMEAVEMERLDVALKAARLNLQEKSRWLRQRGSVRSASSDEHIVDEAISERMRQVRINSSLAHTKAVGAPNSHDRLRQYDEEKVREDEMRSRGITRGMVPGMARRDVDISDEAHKTWFLSLEEGIDTVVSAAASNANAWKTTSSPEARQRLYEQHFKTYLESKAASKSVDAFAGEWSLREVVVKLAKEAGWKNHAPPSGSLRFVICGYCGQSAFTASQWGHLCPAVKGLVENDGVDTGLTRNRPDQETQFMEGRSSSHPNAGTLSISQGGRAGRVYEFKTRNHKYGFVVIPLYFANCVFELGDVAEVELSDEDLDKLGLMWWDPNPSLRKWKNEGRFPQFLRGDHLVGRQIIDKRPSDSWRETVAVAAHIRCSTSPLSYLDNIPINRADLKQPTLQAVIDEMWKASVKGNELNPFRIAGCDNCSFSGISRTLKQHKCAATGKKERGTLDLSSSAHDVSTLPTIIRFRFWLAHRNPTDTLNPSGPKKNGGWVDDKVLTWSVPRSRARPGQYFRPKADGRSSSSRGKRKAAGLDSGRKVRRAGAGRKDNGNFAMALESKATGGRARPVLGEAGPSGLILEDKEVRVVDAEESSGYLGIGSKDMPIEID